MQLVNRVKKQLQAANAQIDNLCAQISESTEAKDTSEVRHERSINRLKRAATHQAKVICRQQQEFADQRELISTLQIAVNSWIPADGSRWQAVWYDQGSYNDSP